MATFLDISALENFSQIFVFLFVWLGVFAVLTYTKIFGDNKFIYILIGMILGIITLFSELTTKIILDIVPWIVLLFMFLVFVSVATQAFGASFEASAYAGLKWILLVFVALAVIIATMSEVRSNITVPGDNETSTDFNRDFSQTATVFFHPNFLGIVLLMAIAVFTIALLSSR